MKERVSSMSMEIFLKVVIYICSELKDPERIDSLSSSTEKSNRTSLKAERGTGV